MKVTDVKIRSVTVAGVDIARNAAHSWHERQAIVLHIADDAGRVGQGEAAPLPGYSPDTIEICAEALNALSPEDLSGARSVAQILERVRELLPASVPAARFGLETALLDLLAQRAGEPLWRLLRGEVHGARQEAPLPLSALVDPSAIERVVALQTRGIRNFKFKLGVLEPAQERERLAELRRRLHRDCELRLDANRSLSRAHASLMELAELCPEYIEEPFALADTLELTEAPVPLALDESLQELEQRARIEAWLERGLCRALTVKPMAVGGVAACLELSRLAGRRGLGLSVSHLFDGPIALTASAHLALAIADESTAQGLFPHPLLPPWGNVVLPNFGAAHIVPTAAPGLGITAVGP